MKISSKQGHAALMFAVAGAAVMGSALAARATVYTTTSQTDTLIENGGTFGGTTRLTAEGTAATTSATLWDYSLLQFNTSTLLPTSTAATGFNSITLNLTDKAESFALAGGVNVYITTYTGAPSGLTYQLGAAFQPQGVGTDTGTLYSLGQINYLKTANTTYSPNGTSISLSTAAQNFILGQINSGGTIGLILAANATNVAGDFQGTTANASFASPSLALDLTTAPIVQNASSLTINGGTKAQTITIGRIVNSATANTTVSLTNSGTGDAVYKLIGSAGTAASLNAPATGYVGIDPIGTGNSTNIIASFTPFTVTGGLTQTGTATATINVHNQSNSTDPDAVITIQSNEVVAARLINNAGSTGNVVQYGRVLGGTTTGNTTVTLDTENTAAQDLTSASLTSVTLLGNTTVSATLTGVSNTTLVKDAATIAAGTSDVLFNDGGVSTNRNVKFTAGTSVGGLYQTKAFYDGYLVVPLVNSDTAIGASTAPTARVYMEADVYQPASVSGASNGTVYSLTNAAHTKNTVNTTLGDIGARSLAQVTSVSLTGQAGYSQAGTIAANTTIADGASVVAANFDKTGKWNGVYTAKLAVGLQNDQTLAGAAPNDLGLSNFTISTTVAGNSGNASVNVLSGGSFAGYSIPSGLAKNSTASLLGGTSTSGNTIAATWANGTSAAALSDQVTLTRTAADTIVVQMTYDPTGVTTATANSPELAYVNGSGVNVLAALGNSNGGTGSSEVIGAYNSNITTLGSYGIDPVAHTVWAVVDHVGAFEAFQRKVGDATGDGTVDLNDLNTVLNNLGVTTALWSKGNFDGASTIDLNDLNAVLNNLGTSLPAGANSVDIAESLLVGFQPDVPATPEPTTLAIAGVGAIGMLMRRRSRAAR